MLKACDAASGGGRGTRETKKRFTRTAGRRDEEGGPVVEAIVEVKSELERERRPGDTGRTREEAQKWFHIKSIPLFVGSSTNRDANCIDVL